MSDFSSYITIYKCSDQLIFSVFLGTSSHSISGAGKTSRCGSGAANSKSAAARASASGKADPSGIASAGSHC